MGRASRLRGAAVLGALLVVACQQPAAPPPAPVPSPSPVARVVSPSPSPSPVPWPVVNALIANPNKVGKDGAIAFNVIVTNPRGVPLTYRWTATGGILSGETAKSATWRPKGAGGAAAPGPVTVTLEVSDGLYRVVVSTPFEVAADGSAMQSGPTRLPNAREKPPLVTP